MGQFSVALNENAQTITSPVREVIVVLDAFLAIPVWCLAGLTFARLLEHHEVDG